MFMIITSPWPVASANIELTGPRWPDSAAAAASAATSSPPSPAGPSSTRKPPISPRCSQARRRCPGVTIPVTASVGAAACPGRGLSAGLAAADAAMYQAKHAGGG